MKKANRFNLTTAGAVMFVLGVLACLGTHCSAQAPAGGGKPPIASVHFGGAGGSSSNAQAARSLTGVVRDANDKTVAGAMVYLKDLKANRMLSVTTGPKGEYQFVGLENDADYEFWAQIEGHKSEVKKVSSFDNTVQMMRALKLK